MFKKSAPRIHTAISVLLITIYQTPSGFFWKEGSAEIRSFVLIVICSSRNGLFGH